MRIILFVLLLTFISKANRFASSDFRPEFKDDLEKYLRTLNQIKSIVEKIKTDLKIEKLIYELRFRRNCQVSD